MAILKVARMGHPVLKKVAKAVDPSITPTKEFQKFIDDMIETMHEYQGVGLAAPQVYESVRVCVTEFDDENPRYKDKGVSGLQVFINPEIKFLTKETEGSWEGCLSVPGLRGYVERFTKVSVKYLDRHGKKHEFETDSFLAVVLQHEFDHLDGTLYIERVKDPKMIAFDQEFERYILPSLNKDDVMDD